LFCNYPTIQLTKYTANRQYPLKMHILQSKHTKLSEKDTKEILNKLNISKTQLPKILSSDPALPEACQIGDVIKIERKDKEKVFLFYRVVV
jgi:DNA-directed RNA polymerase subunit H